MSHLVGLTVLNLGRLARARCPCYSQVLNGIRTELVVIPYADRTFVIVTQLKKLGNLVRDARRRRYFVWHASSYARSLQSSLSGYPRPVENTVNTSGSKVLRTN